jgi:hypothetical protein
MAAMVRVFFLIPLGVGMKTMWQLASGDPL